jgi:hypothetical protein
MRRDCESINAKAQRTAEPLGIQRSALRLPDSPRLCVKKRAASPEHSDTSTESFTASEATAATPPFR